MNKMAKHTPRYLYMYLVLIQIVAQIDPWSEQRMGFGVEPINDIFCGVDNRQELMQRALKEDVSILITLP